MVVGVIDVVKLEAIAKAANVSIATASNALSGKGRMRPEKRREIIKVAQEMGYPLNPAAKKQASPVVLILAEDLLFVNTGVIVTAASRKAEELGYQAVIVSLDVMRRGMEMCPDKDQMRELIAEKCRCISLPVAGMIYVAQYTRNITGMMPNLPYPVIFAYCTGDDRSVYINYDDRQGAFVATKELIDQGCRSIAMISGPINTLPMIERMNGYQQALIDGGLTFNPKTLCIGDWSEASGYQTMLEILDSKQAVDGLFAQNDLMASGALYALHKRHVRVPEDIAIIGFDNNRVCCACYPRLSSVALPLEDIARVAVEKLHARLNRKAEGAHDIVLPCTLVRRESSDKRKQRPVNEFTM